MNHRDALEMLPPGFEHNNDNRIIAIALAVKERNQRKKVAMVSKDINMRVKGAGPGT